MSKKFSLFDFLPVFRSDNSTSAIIPMTNINSDWIDNLEKIGKKGENLVKDFLEKQYNAEVEKQPDYKGYDFKVTIGTRSFFIEVKTSYGENHFYMSYNEMRRAEELREYYYLYYVSIDNKSCNLYILNNPYEVFQLEKILDTCESGENIHMRIESIRFDIKDLECFTIIENFEKYVRINS